MNTIRFDLTDPRLPSVSRAVAVGVFDGVHQAHRQVIGQIVGHTDLSATVLTFADSPAALPKKAYRLETVEQKKQVLDQLGVQELVEMAFADVRELSPADFVGEILHKRLTAKLVACGENFRFGKGGVGDAALLRTLCEPLGITVCIVPTLVIDGQPVSSTVIRNHLADGDMQTVHRLLGHPYTIRTAVVEGNHLGRTAGVPTVNQPLPDGAVWPAFGVYASTVVVGGRSYRAITNIGKKPTVGGDTPLAETCIFDYDGDLYGETPILTPVKFIRPEKRFDTTDELFAQIKRDVETVRAFFRPTGQVRAVFFDFDDTLHSRVIAWRRLADRYAPLCLPEGSKKRQEELADDLWATGGCGHGYDEQFVDIPYERLFADIKARWGLTASVQDLIDGCLPLFAACTAVFPDAAPTIRALRNAGFFVGIITNGRSFTQNRKLHFSGLLPLIDAAVIAGSEGVQKPDPELFIRAALRAGIAPEDCLYVGDNPRADILGATTAGMTPVYMDRQDERRLKDTSVRRITALSELTAVLLENH